MWSSKWSKIQISRLLFQIMSLVFDHVYVLIFARNLKNTVVMMKDDGIESNPKKKSKSYALSSYWHTGCCSYLKSSTKSMCLYIATIFSSAAKSQYNINTRSVTFGNIGCTTTDRWLNQVVICKAASVNGHIFTCNTHFNNSLYQQFILSCPS